jgi:uncharacterized membrane protein YdjX (TVP38/TMEM64 family)
VDAAQPVRRAAVAAEPAVIDETLTSAASWCRDAGALGVLGFALLYCVATALVMPAAILTVAAGWIWGLVWGTVLVQGISLVADWVPFALARRHGRARARTFLTRRTIDPDTLDALVRHRGFAMVALLRLSPVVPFNVMNYLLGLTSVSTRTYLVASLIGSTPACVFFVWTGTLVADRDQLARAASAGGAPAWALWATAIVTIAVAVALWALCRRAVRQALG